VVLADGTQIPTHTLVWAAGVQASPLADMVGAEQSRGGQVIVEEDLSLPDHPNVFIVGDMAAIEGEADGWLPQLAQVAIQSGRHAAKQIQRQTDGQPTEAFSYTDLGQMATIGRNAAVAELAGGIKFKGLIAWLMWVVIHIAKLVGFRNRASVFMDWIYNYFTYERHARLILNMDGSSDRDVGPLVDVRRASSGDHLPAPVRPTPEQQGAERSV
jgi:NADH dehydrogenase